MTTYRHITTILLAVVIIAVLPDSSAAQSLRNMGIKFGGALATQKWSVTTGTAPQTAYHFGPAAGIFLEGADIYGLTTLGELWYVKKGFTNTVTQTSPALTYISIPVMLKYRYEDGGIEYYALAGPRIDLLFQVDPQGVSLVKTTMKQWTSDAGLTAGLGVEWSHDYVMHAIAELRFSPSFVDARGTNGTLVRNNSFEFVLGLGFL